MRSHSLVSIPVLGLIALLTSLATGAAASDPWALVPLLPTACYDEQDGFGGKTATAPMWLPVRPRPQIRCSVRAMMLFWIVSSSSTKNAL